MIKFLNEMNFGVFMNSFKTGAVSLGEIRDYLEGELKGEINVEERERVAFESARMVDYVPTFIDESEKIIFMYKDFDDFKGIKQEKTDGN